MDGLLLQLAQSFVGVRLAVSTHCCGHQLCMSVAHLIHVVVQSKEFNLDVGLTCEYGFKYLMLGHTKVHDVRR